MKEQEILDNESAGEEPFLSRWSRRKQASHQAPVVEAEAEAEPAIPADEPPPLTDADMPPLESLDENSDYSGFLSPEVTEELRQLALQKLFRSACFNVCDGLDDYAEDFTKFEKLGDLMTADLRFRLQEAAKRAAERANAEVSKAEQPDASDSTLDTRRSEAGVAQSSAASETPQNPAGKPPTADEAET